jgi:16S rRNA (cytosine967-C5)-methyltransferase
MALPDATVNHHFENRLRLAIDFLTNKTSETPLELQIRNYFRLHPNMGSRDRRLFQDLIYGYFRLAYALKDLSLKDALTAAHAIWSSENPYLTWTQTEWKNEPLLPVPYSQNISKESLEQGFFAPRKVFLRQMEKGNFVFSKWLLEQGILDWQEGSTLALKKSRALDDAPGWAPGRFEVMDLAVQHWSEEIPKVPEGKILDACCGSGGKSLLLQAANPNTEITATDVRDSILKSYRARVSRHAKGITVQQKDWSIAADWHEEYAFILADVPCSGSGTWMRNPMDLGTFTSEQLAERVEMQKNIVRELSKTRQKGGQIMYVTCSILEEENEKIVEFMQSELHLTCIWQKYFFEWEKGGDAIFAAFME